MSETPYLLAGRAKHHDWGEWYWEHEQTNMTVEACGETVDVTIESIEGYQYPNISCLAVLTPDEADSMAEALRHYARVLRQKKKAENCNDCDGTGVFIGVNGVRGICCSYKQEHS